jgi:acetyltransferase
VTELTLPPLQPRYPRHLINCWRLADGRTITIRPIRHDDGALEQDFVRSLSPRTRYYRFFNAIRELSPAMLDRLTHIDYRRQMTLVAVVYKDGVETQIGMAQYVAEPHVDSCDLAIVVHDAWQRQGLGSLLIDSLIRCARAAGFSHIEGDVMADNYAMLKLVRSLGFSVSMSPADATLVRVRKTLTLASDYFGALSHPALAVPCAG